ncbi:MAG TPA: DUF86 domain-containing protein [Anaerolineae bacterium]|nr:DUF86 domain-containing protein [Anaerolineae bacterium]
MKKRDPSILLQDMLEAIQYIESYVRGLSFEEFYADKLRQDGVVRRIEIIGEAARNLPSDFQKTHSEIPWSDIIGMRAKVVHDYFDVDLETVWETVSADLPSQGMD